MDLMVVPVKIVVQVKLVPDAVQASALGATLRTVNDLATWVSEVAFVNTARREPEPHHLQDDRDRG